MTGFSGLDTIRAPDENRQQRNCTDKVNQHRDDPLVIDARYLVQHTDDPGQEIIHRGRASAQKIGKERGLALSIPAKKAGGEEKFDKFATHDQGEPDRHQPERIENDQRKNDIEKIGV